MKTIDDLVSMVENDPKYTNLLTVAVAVGVTNRTLWVRYSLEPEWQTFLDLLAKNREAKKNPHLL